MSPAQFEMHMACARQAQLRAEYYKLRVETGAYKTRNVHDGYGRRLTENELAIDEINTMSRHLSIAQEHLELAIAFL